MNLTTEPSYSILPLLGILLLKQQDQGSQVALALFHYAAVYSTIFLIMSQDIQRKANFS